ncbi:MAG: hypothetical protein F4X23_07400 [Gemmatimonadales bacterium]|nr:hypothetical protein [Gemmatimonadales bacterium]
MVDMKAFEEAFEVVRVVTLEETDDVMTVTPRIVADGQSSMAFTMAFGLGGPEPAVYVADAGRVVAVYGEDLEGLSDQVASLVTPDLVEGKT